MNKAARRIQRMRVSVGSCFLILLLGMHMPLSATRIRLIASAADTARRCLLRPSGFSPAVALHSVMRTRAFAVKIQPMPRVATATKHLQTPMVGWYAFGQMHRGVADHTWLFAVITRRIASPARSAIDASRQDGGGSRLSMVGRNEMCIRLNVMLFHAPTMSLALK